MKKRIFTIGFLLSAGFTFSQGIYNNGANIVVSSGTYLVIDGNTGNFRNETSGNDGVIDLDGTLKLGGNFTNNVAATDVFGVVGVGAEVSFVGTSTQTIGGSTSAVYNFPAIHVESTSSLEVTHGKQLTLSGNTQVEGSITLLDDGTGVATYIDNGTIFGSGTYNVQQYLTGSGGATPNGRRWYVSSPVTGAHSSTFSPSTGNYLGSYNEPTANYTVISNDVTSLSVGVGYVYRGGSSGNVTYSGSAFNTGTVSRSSLTYTGSVSTVSSRGSHLFGNPYPSFYDWESATLTNVSTTMTYRTATAGGTMVYDTYNASSHVGSNNNGSGAVTRYIPPNQSFWVDVLVGMTGQVDFSNTGRSHQIGTLRDDMISSLVRLNLTDGTHSDQFITNLNTDATTDFDTYDSRKKFVNSIPQLYSRINDNDLVITTIPEIINSETRIPLSLNIPAQGNFSFHVEEIAGDLNNYQVLLEDKQLQTITNLTSHPDYSFQMNSGENHDRFSLIFMEQYSGNSAGVNQLVNEDLMIYANNGNIFVNLTESNGVVNVYDISGRKLLSRDVNTNLNTIEATNVKGIVCVEVITGSKRTIKKVYL